MAEQECPFDEEFDGNDFCATHFLGEIDGEPAGCIRVRYFAGFVKLERLAVRQEYRTSRLSFRLVREAIAYCRRKGYARAYGHSRSDLTRFWGLFGFQPIAGRESFTFSDVEYVELEAVLTEPDDPIAIGKDPYVLIRPEGEWDRPGPLDRSRTRSTADRLSRIRDRLRASPAARSAPPAMDAV
jgi:predicted GNAT family N-acyltransferase